MDKFGSVSYTHLENEKEFLHLADEVIVLSKDTQQILAEGYGVSSDKMHLVYNGLGDGLCFDKDKNVGNGRIILFVGRLDEIKGLNYLIHAFRHIAVSYTHLLFGHDAGIPLSKRFHMFLFRWGGVPIVRTIYSSLNNVPIWH